MPDPVNQWKPVTDLYREQAEAPATAEAENQQKLLDVQEANLRKPWTQGKAPLGIRIFTWYYFLRAGICAFLLFVMATFPHSAASTMLSDGMNSFIMRAGKSHREARRHRSARAPQANNAAEDAIADEEPSIRQDRMHEILMVFLLFNLAVSAVIGFLWWNRIRFIRWLTMFYAGASVVKDLLNIVGGPASGLASGSSPLQAPLLMVSLGINGAILLYLAFGYGVKKWFQPGLYQ